MPNSRMLLWVALAAILYLNYEAWMHDYPAAGQRDAAGQSAAGGPGAASNLGDSVPQAASSAAPPATAPTTATTLGKSPPPTAEPFTPPPVGATAPDDSASQPVHVSTDVFNVAINLKGGELDQADLLQYPLRKDAPNIPVRLLSRAPPESLYLLQTGLIGGAGEAAPTHLTTWSSVQKNLLLSAGAQGQRGPVAWT